MKNLKLIAAIAITIAFGTCHAADTPTSTNEFPRKNETEFETFVRFILLGNAATSLNGIGEASPEYENRKQELETDIKLCLAIAQLPHKYLYTDYLSPYLMQTHPVLKTIWRDINPPIILTEPMAKVASSQYYSPDGQRTCVLNINTAAIIDIATGKSIGKTLQHDDLIHTVSFSPNGRYIVTTSSDRTARLWDAGTGEPIGNQLQHPAKVYTATFSPDSMYIVTVSCDHSVHIWDANTCALIGEPLLQGNNQPPVFSPDSKRIVIFSGLQTAYILDTATGAHIGKPLAQGSYIHSVEFSPDSQLIVIASYDEKVRIWDATTGSIIGSPLRHLPERVLSAVFSMDGQHIITITQNGTRRMWDIEPPHLGWEQILLLLLLEANRGNITSFADYAEKSAGHVRVEYFRSIYNDFPKHIQENIINRYQLTDATVDTGTAGTGTAAQ